jgi:hypothetical protein
MVYLLACDCDSCVAWEIVKLADGSIHLHCKTCERRDELDSFVVHEKPGSQMRWITREEE